MKKKSKQLKLTSILLVIGLVVVASFLLVRYQSSAQKAQLQFVTEDYPPFTYLDDKGEITGIVTEMVKEIMDRQDIDEEINLMPWSDAYEKALNEKNVVIFSIRRTEQREDLFNWVGPIIKTETIFYAKKDSGIAIDSMEEAKKISKIGVVSDWFSAQNLEEDGFENLVASAHPTEVVEKLMKGEVLIAPFTNVTIKDIMEEAGYAKNDLEPVFTIDTGYNYIGLSKETSQSIVKEWQGVLDEMKADGTFDEIYNKYTQ